jgi:hypothetical protein
MMYRIKSHTHVKQAELYLTHLRNSFRESQRNRSQLSSKVTVYTSDLEDSGSQSRPVVLNLRDIAAR